MFSFCWLFWFDIEFFSYSTFELAALSPVFLTYYFAILDCKSKNDTETEISNCSHITFQAISSKEEGDLTDTWLQCNSS